MAKETIKKSFEQYMQEVNAPSVDNVQKESSGERGSALKKNNRRSYRAFQEKLEKSVFERVIAENVGSNRLGFLSKLALGRKSLAWVLSFVFVVGLGFLGATIFNDNFVIKNSDAEISRSLNVVDRELGLAESEGEFITDEDIEDIESLLSLY